MAMVYVSSIDYGTYVASGPTDPTKPPLGNDLTSTGLNRDAAI